MPRIPMVVADNLDPEQRRVYDRTVSGPRGAIVGPLRAALHSPALADRWEALGRFLRFDCSLDLRTRELAIIVCARRWISNLEWIVHGQAAQRADVPAAVMEAIRTGAAPAFDNEYDKAVYDYCCELLDGADVSDETYEAAYGALGTVGIVELSALIGYYTMVAMSVNVHRVPLPAYDEASFKLLEPGKFPEQRGADQAGDSSPAMSPARSGVKN